MKINFKTLCTVGALLCMGNTYAGDNSSIDANPFCEKSNVSTMTWEKFEKTADEDLPKNIIMKSEGVLIYDSNIDRLIRLVDRLILEDCDLVSYVSNDTTEKLKTFLSVVFSKSPRVRYLSFARSDETGIPKEIKNLSSLFAFEMISSQVKNLPKEVCHLSSLNLLNLSCTHIRSLPKEIRNLSNLTKLYLDSTLIESLPKEIGKLSKLTYLGLRGTPIKYIPKEIEDLSNLSDVILSTGHNFSVTRFLTKNHTDIHSGITYLCFENGDFDGIESLDLSDKRLDRVPCDIVSLKSLKKLNLSNNNLESIPLFLRNVKNLEILDISKNNIASLPTEIWPFPRTLKYLTIDGFLLKNIPDDRIESITNMRELNEGKINTEYFARLIVAKINNQPSSNKLLLESLGGTCIVKLKDPLEEKPTKPSPEDKPSASKICQIQ